MQVNVGCALKSVLALHQCFALVEQDKWMPHTSLLSLIQYCRPCVENRRASTQQSRTSTVYHTQDGVVSSHIYVSRRLSCRVEEFRDSIGAAGVEWDGDAGGLVGLDALQERVQDQGRKAIDDKITTFQVSMCVSVCLCFVLCLCAPVWFVLAHWGGSEGRAYPDSSIHGSTHPLITQDVYFEVYDSAGRWVPQRLQDKNPWSPFVVRAAGAASVSK